ncbi:MAG TPA: response regulator transcription factor [Gemmataceae bacterium]|nr:response regulator transcription factor [Gemmataceae bacterium]
MTKAAPIVFVVDDDASVRRALARLLQADGLTVATFASAKEFLHHGRADAPACLVLDVRLPELDGLELQRSLNEENSALPIVFITGHGDIPMSVRAMKAGAVDFLPKPFDDQELLSAVRQAIAKDLQGRREQASTAVLRERAESLTAREHEVMALVVSGLLNKQIGHRLGVSEKTVKVHRGQAMRKMRAGSLAELVRMAEKIGIKAAP